MIQERKNDMASIIKRKKNYSVVYNYVDENGETSIEDILQKTFAIFLKLMFSDSIDF